MANELQIPILTTDAPLAPPGSAAQVKDETQRRLYEDAYAAVVQLKTDTGTGSGFFVDDKGHVVTAAHVVAGSKEAVAITVNGKSYRAKIVELSDTTDLAMLQLQDFDGSAQKYLKLADNSQMTADQSVYAIGYPKGFRPAYLSPGEYKANVTVYDLVNKDKTAIKFKSATKTEKADLLKALSGKVIQGEVHVERGNSGGPLLNSEGRVIGVTDIASEGDVTISYYRPVEDVRSLLADDRKSSFTITYTHVPTAPNKTFMEGFKQSAGSDSLDGVIADNDMDRFEQYSLARLQDDCRLYSESTYTPDILKYGASCLFDAAIVAGVKARYFAGMIPIAPTLLNIGILGRMGADLIPHRLVLEDIRRTDGDPTPPFMWRSLDFKPANPRR